MIKALVLASLCLWGALSFAHASEAFCDGQIETLKQIAHDQSKGVFELTALDGITTTSGQSTNSVACFANFHFVFLTTNENVRTFTTNMLRLVPGVTLTPNGFMSVGTYHVLRSDDGAENYVTLDN